MPFQRGENEAKNLLDQYRCNKGAPPEKTVNYFRRMMCPILNRHADWLPKPTCLW